MLGMTILHRERKRGTTTSNTGDWERGFRRSYEIITLNHIICARYHRNCFFMYWKHRHVNSFVSLILIYTLLCNLKKKKKSHGQRGGPIDHVDEIF